MKMKVRVLQTVSCLRKFISYLITIVDGIYYDSST